MMIMKTRNLQTRPVTPSTEQNPNPNFLSLMFGKEAQLPFVLDKKEEQSKVETFEKGLATSLSPTDTLEEAMTKMVKVALVAEFGLTMLKEKGAENMVRTIVRGILGDAVLRKQALLIVDRMLTKKDEREAAKAING
jgi:hypothetical protein